MTTAASTEHPLRQGGVTKTVAASADEVFALLTDVDRLPEWNHVIKRVVDRPREFGVGADWKVELKPPGMPSWESLSSVLVLDRNDRRFRYRSSTDDGNPSYGIWEWQVDEAPEGATVRVTWELHPKTFVRKVLLSPVRNRALKKEVAESISRLEDLASSQS